MSVFSSIRKGFSFFLMSMGVSTYAKKPVPRTVAEKPVADPPENQK